MPDAATEHVLVPWRANLLGCCELVIKSQNRQGVRPHGAAVRAGARRRGDRIAMQIVAARSVAIDVVDGARSQQRAALA